MCWSFAKAARLGVEAHMPVELSQLYWLSPQPCEQRACVSSGAGVQHERRAAQARVSSTSVRV